MGAVDKKAPGKIQQEKLSVVTALNGCKKDESRNETEKKQPDAKMKHLRSDLKDVPY